MKPHFNELTPAEAERLAMLAEEMGEALQLIGKILRHGYRSRHPNGGPTNRRELQDEIGDVLGIVDMMAKAGDVSGKDIDRHRESKQVSVLYWAHHQVAALPERKKI